MESLARDRDRKLMLERLFSDATADAAAGAAASSAPGTPISGDWGLGAARRYAEAAAGGGAPLPGAARDAPEPEAPGCRANQAPHRGFGTQAAAEDSSSAAVAPALARNGRPPRRRLAAGTGCARCTSRSRASTARSPSRRARSGACGRDWRLPARLEAVPGIESEWVALTRDYDTLTGELSRAPVEERELEDGREPRAAPDRRAVPRPRPPAGAAEAEQPESRTDQPYRHAAGLSVGLLLLGLAYVRDSTMRSEADVLGAIELPVLVLLPFVATDADLRRERRLRWMTWAAAMAVFGGTAALVWFLRLWKYVV